MIRPAQIRLWVQRASLAGPQRAQERGTFVEQDAGQSAAPLDRALEEWVAAVCPTWAQSRRRDLMARIGWHGLSAPTLEEIGEREGLTRERMRQLQVKLEQRLDRSPRPANPALDAAVDAVRDTDSAASRSLGQLLVDCRLLADPLPDAGLRLLFRLLGEGPLFDAYIERRRVQLPDLKDALHMAKDLTRSVGVASIDWVASDHGSTVPVAVLQQALDEVPWCARLDEDWFWDPATPPGRNRLVNVTTKMLAACGDLSVHDVRDGLDRIVRLGRMPHLPSMHALRLFFDAHPDFTIDANDVVASTWELDPEEELDTSELTIYRILSRAPDGFLDRANFFRQAIAAGMNQNTFSVYSSYSPIVDNPMQDRWILRGNHISPAAMEAQRPQRRRRWSSNEWTPAGTLRLERETPDYWTLVISVPRALSSYVADRSFRALDPEGRSVGQVKWDANGTSWGYSAFLQQAAAADGDILEADFDLVAGAVRLSLRRSPGQGKEQHRAV